MLIERYIELNYSYDGKNYTCSKSSYNEEDQQGEFLLSSILTKYFEAKCERSHGFVILQTFRCT